MSRKSWLELVADLKRSGHKFDPDWKRPLNCWNY